MAERRLAVLFGSGTFSEKMGELPDLRCPPKDVEDFAEVLLDPERGGFISVDKLVDRPWYEVITKINGVLQEATYEDLVLIYYSGHGKLNRQGKLHLATPETTLSNLGATSVSVDYIRSCIDGTLAERVILILDCCYSGKVGDAWLKSSISDGMQTSFEAGKGIYILTASTGLQTAQEKEGEKYSVFTKSLIEGIRTGEADSGRDGQISMEDIYNYVTNEVAKVSPQTPMRWNFYGRGDILIARSGRGRRTEFAAKSLLQKRPASLDDFSLPRTGKYFPSPSDWCSEVLYFILLDRFSDGFERERPILKRNNLKAARPADWRWDLWAESGASRWQGGNLSGVRSKLDYLKNLGVTTLWLSPVMKQRGHLDSYHGYAVQDFLDVDPHFGTRQDLVDLVQEAHGCGMRVILSVIINHSGPNWLYPPETPGGPFIPRYTSGRYPFGNWMGSDGQPIKDIENDEDGVWPAELQAPDIYIRAGTGDLGAGDLDNPNSEQRRSDLFYFRKFDLTKTVGIFAQIFRYWIALTDCDGFQIDMLKHLSFDEVRLFCSSIREFAATLDKHDFLLVGEVVGGEYNQSRYLDAVGQNLSAALDISEKRLAINDVAKGMAHPDKFFNRFDPNVMKMGSHRDFAKRRITILDDHDHVVGKKVRFSSYAMSDHQVVAGVALQLLTLGIPCIYYGTEQALAGPEPEVRVLLPDWGRSDRYLREAMFGPNHPKLSGCSGFPVSGLDSNLPGFGPFGTSGHHCFDESNPTFLKIAALINTRQSSKALQSGRQYLRPTRILDKPFEVNGPGELIAWSRILGDDELLCVVNSHGVMSRSADVVIDREMNANRGQMVVKLNTAQVGISDPVNYSGSHPIESHVRVNHDNSGNTYVEIRDLQPSEVLVLSNNSKEV